MDCIDCCAPDSGPDDSILQTSPRRSSQHHPHAAVSTAVPHVDPYQVLELRRDATDTEIVESYRKLALWHHPGRARGKEPPEETKRRLVFFQILSHCYETLMHKESRRRFDMQMKRQEGKRLVGIATAIPSNTASDAASKELVPRPSISAISTQKSGDRRSRLNTGTSSHHHVLVHHEEGDGGLPPLTHSSSSEGSSAKSHSSSSHQNHMEASSSAFTQMAAPSFGFFCAPRLTQVASGNNHELANSSKSLQVGQSSTSRSTLAEEPEIHFTEATVNRLFGGPLAPLHQARNFEPFTDPFVVFERVFGNPVFPRVTPLDIGETQTSTALTTHNSHQNNNQLALCHHKSSGWTGSAHKEPDGLTTVFVSSRVFHNRKITRTETVHLDPETGKAHSEVKVDGEQFVVEPFEKEQGKYGDCPSGWILCHRGGAQTSIEALEPEAQNDDNHTEECFHNFQSAYGNAMEEFYLWNRELYGPCIGYM